MGLVDVAVGSVSQTFDKLVGRAPAISAPPESEEYKYGFGVDLRGLTPDYHGWRNPYWGQPQPVSYSLLWKAFLEDEVVAAAIKTTADRILADGWDLKCKDETHLEKLKLVLRHSQFNKSLRDVVIQLLIYGDAYFELVRGNVDLSSADSASLGKALKTMKNNMRKRFSYDVSFEKKVLSFSDESLQGFNCEWEEYGPTEVKAAYIDGNAYTGSPNDAVDLFVQESEKESGQVYFFKPLDASTIRVDYDHHGRIFRFIQRKMQRRVDFYTDEIVHLSIDNVGGRVYGLSGLNPLLRKLLMRASAEKYNEDWFKRSGMPRIIYLFKRLLNKEQEKRYAKTLKSAGYHQDVVLSSPEAPEVVQVAPKNSDMQFAELLNYLREMILVGLQVPPSLVGLGQGGRQTTQHEYEAYDLRIKFLKRALAEMFNEQLFTPKNFGGPDVEFVFRDDNARELHKRAQAAQMASMVTSDGGAKLLSEEQLANILGIELDEEHLKEAEKMVAERMMQQQQPFGAKPGKQFDNPKQGAQQNPEHKDNAEVNNAEQQKENKGVDLVQGAFSSRRPLNRPPDRYDSTYGAKPTIDIVELKTRLKDYEAWMNYLRDALASMGYYGLNDMEDNPQESGRRKT